jgi:hypothetical protein
MLFKLLKLFGLDVRAEIAAVKGEITRRVDDATDRARQLALGGAVIAVLAMFAGLFFVTALGVGLVALYRIAETTYGPDAALGIIAAVLLAAILILLVAALIVARSLKSPPSPRPSAVGADVAGAGSRAVPPPQPPPEAVAAPLMSSGDLVEPLTLVLGLFAKDPKLGHPTLDQFVAGLPNGGAKPDEAVAQALDVIRNGDRTQLAIILGAAVAAGWLLARARPQPGNTPGSSLQ